MKWISVKDSLPPLKEFVEVVHSPKSRMNSNFRSFCAIWKDPEDGIFWAKDGIDEVDYGSFDITHWRPMFPDPRGRKAYLYAKKNGYIETRMRKPIASQNQSPEKNGE